MSGEEGAIVIEPALCFKELEEEQSCDVDESEGASIIVVDAIRPCVRDVGDVSFQGAEEASANCMSAQQVVPAETGQCRVRVPCGGEGGDRLCVRIEDVGWRCGEDGESRSAWCAEPGCDGEWTVVAAVNEDEPASGVGETIEVSGRSAQRFAPVRGVGVFDEQECG